MSQRSKARKVNVMEAVRWAFATVWHNPRIWMLGTLLLILSILTIGLALLGLENLFARYQVPTLKVPNSLRMPEDFGPEVSLIPLLLTPVLYAGALAQVGREKIEYRDFFRNTHYWKVVGVSFVGTVFWWAVDYLLSAALPAQESVGNHSFWYSLGVIAGGLLSAILGLLTHLLILAWGWYAADGYGIGEAVVEGAKAVWHNFFRLALLYVVGIFCMGIGLLFTLLIGGFILVPASLLIAAHLCRQANGGPLPARE